MSRYRGHGVGPGQLNIVPPSSIHDLCTETRITFIEWIQLPFLLSEFSCYFFFSHPPRCPFFLSWCCVLLVLTFTWQNHLRLIPDSSSPFAELVMNGFLLITIHEFNLYKKGAMSLLLIAIFTKYWFVCYLLTSKQSAGYEALNNNIYVTRGEDINISNISQSAVNVAESTTWDVCF